MIQPAAIVAILVGVSGLLAACGSSTPAGFTSAPEPVSSSASSAILPSAGMSVSPTIRPRPSSPTADIGVKVVADGLVAPDGLVAAPDTSGRLFLIDQTGKVFILQGGAINPQPFLDVSARLVALDPSYDERGLLGLAFEPDFAQTGRVFVFYTAKLRKSAAAGMDHTDVISSFTVNPSDPNRVDPASEKVILRFEQPQPNHDGGGLGFGPDGFLYIGVGDGGSEGDVGPGHTAGGSAQDTNKLNGKICGSISMSAATRPTRFRPTTRSRTAVGSRRSTPSACAIRGASPGSRAAIDGCSSTMSAGAASRRSTWSPPAATTAGRSGRARIASMYRRRCPTFLPAL